MSDMTHYTRARTWLDDPGTIAPDAIRAEMNAALATATAQRETEKSVARLAQRVEDLTAAIRDGLRHRPFIRVPDGLVNLARIDGVTSMPDGKRSRIHTGQISYVIDGTPAEVAESLGIG